MLEWCKHAHGVDDEVVVLGHDGTRTGTLKLHRRRVVAVEVEAPLLARVQHDGFIELVSMSGVPDPTSKSLPAEESPPAHGTRTRPRAVLEGSARGLIVTVTHPHLEGALLGVAGLDGGDGRIGSTWIAGNSLTLENVIAADLWARQRALEISVSYSEGVR